MLISGLIVFSLSCSRGSGTAENTVLDEDDTNQEQSPEIDINKPNLGDKVLKLSDIAGNIEYIPLETNKNCLIKNINALELVGPYIYVSSPGQLLLFDTDGHFVRRIGSEGNGPGEYNAIADIAVDNVDSSVYLINILGKKIMHFSIDGEFLDSFPLDFPVVADNIELYDGNIYLSFSDMVNSPGDESKKVMLAAFTRSGNMIGKYGSTLPVRDNLRVNIMLPCEVLYTYDNALFVKEVRSDTLYRISEDEILDPRYVFNFSESKMPLHEYSYESFTKHYMGGKYLYFLKVLENQNNIFFTYKHNGDETHCIHDKISKKLYRFGSTQEYSKIPDDIKSGPGFWPVFSREDDYLIGYLEPSLLTEQEMESLSGIVGNVDISSNPVLQIVRN